MFDLVEFPKPKNADKARVGGYRLRDDYCLNFVCFNYLPDEHMKNKTFHDSSMRYFEGKYLYCFLGEKNIYAVIDSEDIECLI